LEKFEMGLFQKICDELWVDVGDLIYLSDQRWYLGGVRSGHFKLKEI